MPLTISSNIFFAKLNNVNNTQLHIVHSVKRKLTNTSYKF